MVAETETKMAGVGGLETGRRALTSRRQLPFILVQVVGNGCKRDNLLNYTLERFPFNYKLTTPPDLKNLENC